MPDMPQTPKPPLKQIVIEWVRAKLDENPLWLRFFGKFLFIVAIPLLLVFFIIDFPHVLKCAQEEEPMDEVPPGIVGIALRTLSIVVAFFVLPIVMVMGIFQTIFGTAPENDPNEII